MLSSEKLSCLGKTSVWTTTRSVPANSIFSVTRKKSFKLSLAATETEKSSSWTFLRHCASLYSKTFFYWIHSSVDQRPHCLYHKYNCSSLMMIWLSSQQQYQKHRIALEIALIPHCSLQNIIFETCWKQFLQTRYETNFPTQFQSPQKHWRSLKWRRYSKIWRVFIKMCPADRFFLMQKAFYGPYASLSDVRTSSRHPC